MAKDIPEIDPKSDRFGIPKLIPFHCRSCGTILGYTNGYQFTVDNCVFPMKVTFICSKCGNTAQWRPIINNLNGE